MRTSSSTSGAAPTSGCPAPDDLLPPQVADFLLAGAEPHELTRLPAARVAGRTALGLRLTPSAPQTSIARMDLWADAETGLPLASGSSPRPRAPTRAHLASSTRSRWRLRRRTLIAFTPPPGVDIDLDPPLDVADAANRYVDARARRTPLAGLPRTGAGDGAVGVYGTGPTRMIVVPAAGTAPPSRCASSSGSRRRRRFDDAGAALTVGPLQPAADRVPGRQRLADQRHGRRVDRCSRPRRRAGRGLRVDDRPMIRTAALTKRFGPITAVDGIDLDVREGDVYGFLGANGSGQVDHRADAARPRAADLRRGRAARGADAAPRPARAAAGGCAGRGTGRLRPPLRPGEPGAASTRWARPAATAATRRDRVERGARAGRAGRRRPPAGPGLLAGHAAAAGSGAGADARPAAARPRRADQRARPAGHPRDPRRCCSSCTPRARRCSSPAICSPRSSSCAPASACWTAAGWCCRTSWPCSPARPAGSVVRTPDSRWRARLLDGRVERASTADRCSCAPTTRPRSTRGWSPPGCGCRAGAGAADARAGRAGRDRSQRCPRRPGGAP